MPFISPRFSRNADNSKLIIRNYRIYGLWKFLYESLFLVGGCSTTYILSLRSFIIWVSPLLLSVILVTQLTHWIIVLHNALSPKQFGVFFEDILQVILLHHNVYLTFSYCWRTNLQIQPGKRRIISYLPLAISWGIWRVRNAFLFSNATPTPASAIFHALDVLRTISHLKSFIFSEKEVFLAQRLGSLTFQQKRHSIQIICWEKPTSYCLNVDGSYLSTGVAGGGCVLRDQSGDVLFAASKFFGVATNV